MKPGETYPTRDYLAHADQGTEKLIKEQTGALVSSGSIRCECGVEMVAVTAYRCLYCGIRFCAPCAEKHFGRTLEEWRRDKQNNKNDT